MWRRISFSRKHVREPSILNVRFEYIPVAHTQNTKHIAGCFRTQMMFATLLSDNALVLLIRLCFAVYFSEAFVHF